MKRRQWRRQDDHQEGDLNILTCNQGKKGSLGALKGGNGKQERVLTPMKRPGDISLTYLLIPLYVIHLKRIQTIMAETLTQS